MEEGKQNTQNDTNPFQPNVEIRRSFYDQDNYQVRDFKSKARFASQEDLNRHLVQKQDQNQRLSSLPAVQSRNQQKQNEYQDIPLRTEGDEEQFRNQPVSKGKPKRIHFNDIQVAPSSRGDSDFARAETQFGSRQNTHHSYLQRQESQRTNQPQRNQYTSKQQFSGINLPSLKGMNEFDTKLSNFKMQSNIRSSNDWVKNIEAQYQEQMQKLSYEMKYLFPKSKAFNIQYTSQIKEQGLKADRKDYKEKWNQLYSYRSQTKLSMGDVGKDIVASIDQKIQKNSQERYPLSKGNALKSAAAIIFDNKPTKLVSLELEHPQTRNTFDSSLITDTRKVPLQYVKNPFQPIFGSIPEEDLGASKTGQEINQGTLTRDMQYYYQADQAMKEIEELNKKSEIKDMYYSKMISPSAIQEIALYKSPQKKAIQPKQPQSTKVTLSLDSKMPKIASYKGIQNRLIQDKSSLDTQEQSYQDYQKETFLDPKLRSSPGQVITSLSLVKDLLNDLRFDNLKPFDQSELEKTLQLSTRRRNENLLEKSLKKKPQVFETLDKLDHTQKEKIKEQFGDNYQVQDVAEITNNTNLQLIYEESLKNAQQLMESN